MAAAVTGLLGPAALANAATADPGSEDAGSTPAQQTDATSDAATSNDAGVEQGAEQSQEGGASDQPQQSAEPAASESSGAQEVEVDQQADASADAKLDKPKNENAAAHVGASGAEDGHGAKQKNKGEADAEASAAADVSQQGAGNGASGDQSANAEARADVDRPSNTNVTARVEAPGHDAAFDQSNEADAKAKAKAKAAGVDEDQKAKAKADAKLDKPSNVAVELRVESDGDSDGGSQRNAANAAADVEAGPKAMPDANAFASILDPANTFVSIRVNSDGTTGPVAQSNSATQSETVNGVTVAQSSPDHADTAWISSDPSSGVAIALVTDGSNTDLRVAVNDATLALPSSAPIFVWTWDMVFGPGAPVTCDIDSSASAGQVSWTFDCDPGNEIVRTGAPATGSTAPGTIAWTWSWDRPELPGWSWDRYDVLAMALAACNCRYVIDFRWISREPTAPAAPQPAQLPVESAQAAVSQSNEASATAVATATVGVEQFLIQSGDLSSESIQSLLQQAQVVQVVSAISVAQLMSPLNTANGLLSVVPVDERRRGSTAAGRRHDPSERRAAAARNRLDPGAGRGAGRGRDAARPRRSRSPQSAHALNSASGRGAANQSVTSQVHVERSRFARPPARSSSRRSRATARPGAARRPVDVRRPGAGARLGRGALDVASTTPASRATRSRRAPSRAPRPAGHPLRPCCRPRSRSRSATTPWQFQEAYQLVDLTQEGEALAAASAGGTPPLRHAARGRAPPSEDAPGADADALRAPDGIAAGVLGRLDRGRTARIRTGSARQAARGPSRAASGRCAPSPLRRARRGGARAVFLQAHRFRRLEPARPARPCKRARDAGRASSGSPRRRGTAPESIGATTFGSSGTGTGGAQAALVRYVLLWVPGLGPRVFSPAGRQPADVRFALQNPG